MAAAAKSVESQDLNRNGHFLDKNAAQGPLAANCTKLRQLLPKN
jgi:hypothetical protein